MEIKLQMRYNYKIQESLAVETPVTIQIATVHPALKRFDLTPFWKISFGMLRKLQVSLETLTLSWAQKDPNFFSEF